MDPFNNQPPTTASGSDDSPSNKKNKKKLTFSSSENTRQQSSTTSPINSPTSGGKKNVSFRASSSEAITSSSTSKQQGSASSSKSISIKPASNSSFIPDTPPDHVMASNSLRMRYLSDDMIEGDSDDEETKSNSSGEDDNRAASVISTRTNSQGLMDLEDQAEEKPKKTSIRKSSKSVAYTMERLGNRSSFYDFDTIGMHRSATRSNFTGRAMDRSMSFFPAGVMSPGSKQNQQQFKRRNSIRRMKSVFDFSRDENMHHDGRALFFDPERGAFIGGSEDDLMFSGGMSQDEDEMSESAKKKFTYRAKVWMKEKYAAFVEKLKIVLRYFYIATFGVLLFLIFNLFSALSWITIFGIEHGKTLFQLSFFMLNPFNKRVFFGDLIDQSAAAGEKTGLLSSSNTSSEKKKKKYPISRLLKHLFWILLIGLPMTFVQSFIVILCWFPIIPIPISKLIFNVNKNMFLPTFIDLTITRKVSGYENSSSINNEDHENDGEAKKEEGEDLSIHMVDPFTFKAFKLKLFSISVPLINLLPLVALTIGLHYGMGDEFTSKYSMVIFALSIVAAMPLAFIIGHCVESIVAQTSFVFGALLNATFGSIIELILYFLALYKGLQGVVSTSVSGAILAAILLTPGLSMIIGGLRFREQYFNRYAAGVSSILLFIAVVGAFLPCIYYLSFGVQQLKCGQCLSGLPYNRTKEEPDLYQTGLLSSGASPYSTFSSNIEGVTTSDSSWFDTAKRTFKSLYGKKYKRPNKSIHGTALKDVNKKTTIGTIYGAPVEIAPHSFSPMDEIQNYHTLLDLKSSDLLTSNFTPITNFTNNSTYSIRCFGCDISLEDFVHDPLYENKVRPLAFTSAIILPFAYFFGLFYSLRTHRFLMQKPPKKAFSGEPTAPTDEQEDQEDQEDESNSKEPSEDSKSTGKASMENLKDSDSEKYEQSPIKSEKDDSNSKTEEETEEEEGIWPIWLAILVLVLCTAAYSFVAEVMTSALEPAFESIGVSAEFAGLTFIATVPSLGEFLNAIQFAWNDNVTLALEIGNVAAIQISLLQIPALVLGSFLIFEGNEKMIFSLTFPQFNLMAIFFSVLVLNYISRDGRSNYFHGLALVFVYIFIVVGFFFIYL